jgi:aminoglycoside phosphotransferase (APT) family kinase protein
MVSHTDEQEIRRLLDVLAWGRGQAPGEWQAWQIRSIVGGANNLLYRATSSHADLAIKFTIRDARDRAGREYAALCALERAHLNVAPKHVLLDRSSYPQPVVVQTWIPGEVRQSPPEAESQWQALLQHHLAVHTLTPQRTDFTLPAAVMNADSAASAWRLVIEQVERIPEAKRPESLRGLLHHYGASPSPIGATASVTLCRTDANITNFI